MDPPIQTEYFLSGGAITFTFIPDGAKAVISLCILSDRPASTYTTKSASNQIQFVSSYKNVSS